MDFGPRSLQLFRPTYALASRTMAFTAQCSAAEGWKAELA